jgi:hypothetical protein
MGRPGRALTHGLRTLGPGNESRLHFGASAGRADARRRAAGDAVPSSRSGNEADARPPPRLASGPGGRQQNVTVIHYQALSISISRPVPGLP